MKRNVDRTRRQLEQHPMTDQVHLDGDSSEAMFRAMIDENHLEDRFHLPDSFESWVEETLEDVEVVRNKWLGFAREVTLR